MGASVLLEGGAAEGPVQAKSTAGAASTRDVVTTIIVLMRADIIIGYCSSQLGSTFTTALFTRVSCPLKQVSVKVVR